MKNERMEILKRFLKEEEIKISSIDTTSYNNYVFEVETIDYDGKCEYKVLTNNEAFEEVKEYIEEGVCYFSPSFLSAVTKFDIIIFESLCEIGENANEAIWSLIESKITKDKFVENVILEGGRGAFISSYDGIENEFDMDEETYYIYRVN